MSGTSSTPTSSNAAGSSRNSSTNGLEDIQYLLYLETLKRFRDNEANIKRQVEEKTRQYLEAKNEHENLYAKYVSLVKLATTRYVLEQENHLNAADIPSAKANIDTILQKLTNDNVVDYLDPKAVEECRQHINACKPNDKLKEIKLQLMENRASTKAIQVAAKGIETTLEMATVQGLNYFVEALYPSNVQNQEDSENKIKQNL